MISPRTAGSTSRARLLARPAPAALDLERERRRGHGLLGVEPGVVHVLARGAERDLPPHDRQRPGAGHGVSGYRWRDLRHEEKRDLLTTFEYIHPEALGVRYINRDPSGRYTLTKEIICDPHHSVVLHAVRLEGHEDLICRG